MESWQAWQRPHPRTIYGDSITFLEHRDALSELCHPTRIFVTKGEWRLESEILLHDVQVGMAHAGSADLDQQLPSPRRRLGNVLDPSGWPTPMNLTACMSLPLGCSAASPTIGIAGGDQRACRSS